ncbi:hypothetical protein niasHS_010032 [Heterodera schachtii]|uniref:Uncharacterized protein n=2 Tax=Heterodera TaxID=34509 RepID=A0ABD2J6W7_HETSC
MTRGHRPASTTTSSSSAAATSSSSSSNNFQQQQTPRRGNKTLGWYLGDKLSGSSANEGDSSGGGGDISSTCNGQMAPQNRVGILQQQNRRRGSLADTTTTTPMNCSKPLAKITDEQQQNSAKISKKHLQQQKQPVTNSNFHRPRANSSSTNAGSKKTAETTSAQSNGSQPVTASNSANDSVKQSTTSVTSQQRNGKGPNGGKEDYWYYDEVSDGFYYEHNGTRGWRKRRPEWGTVEQMKGMTGAEHNPKRVTEQQQMVLIQQHLLQKQKTLEAKTSGASCVAVPSLLAPQQLNKFSAQHLPHEHLLSPNSANFKYYDPTTDGFYYEMASFDGWKRRQPQSGASAVDGTSPPQGTLSPPSSYCSPLLDANGDQFTKTTSQQQQCTSPGPNHQKQKAPHRKVQPLHYQAYQQPAPHLNSAELQEMILLAQQNQHHLRSASSSVPSCCCSQLSCCPTSAGNGTSACCCTNIAAMAAQLVLKQQQKLAEQMQSQPQNNFNDNNNNNGFLTESNKSLTDNIRPLLDMETKLSLLDSLIMDGLNKPKMGPLVRPTQCQQLMNNSVDSLKLPRNKWDHHQLGGIMPSPPPLLPSLQEPYEFYWSGDEAGSEVIPLSIANLQQNEQTMTEAKNEKQSVVVPPFTLSTGTTTAASVSSIEEDDADEYGMLDEYMANVEKQRKIAPIGSEANHLGNGSKKRPNTLKLSCPKPMSVINNGNIPNGLSAAYEPISPGEILRDDQQNFGNNNNDDRKKGSMADTGDVPYQFNVDKFISDILPQPTAQQQSLLYNSELSSNNRFFTPLAQQPLTADSPLFTPIVPSIGHYGVKDPWYYGKVNDISSAHPLQQPLMDSTNPWAYP